MKPLALSYGELIAAHSWVNRLCATDANQYRILTWLLALLIVASVSAVSCWIAYRIRAFLKTGFWRSGHFWKYGPMGRAIRGLDPDESKSSLWYGKNRYF